MGFVLLGLVLGLLKLAGLPPAAHWSWWVVASPFLMAIAWWAASDALGFTQRRAMRREQARAEERRERQWRDMGTGGPAKRPGDRGRDGC